MPCCTKPAVKKAVLPSAEDAVALDASWVLSLCLLTLRRDASCATLIGEFFVWSGVIQGVALHLRLRRKAHQELVYIT